MRLTLLLCLLAGTASAEGATIRADLDGNGHAESFRLIVPENDPRTDLEIAGQWQTVIYENLGWAGISAGTLPRLELAPNGSLRLITQNAAVGRNRWELVLTIVHRDGSYRVGGFTYSFYDTLDLDAGGFCDVNLLTGRGLVQAGKGEERAVREWTMRAPELSAWTAETIPAVCLSILDG